MLRLRFKKNKQNYSLYIDYNVSHTIIDEKGKIATKRKVEFLKLYTSLDYSKRKHIEKTDKETMEIANAILKKRELALLVNDKELLPRYDNASFLDFFQNQLEAKNHRTYNATLNHLKEYSNSKLRFKDVDSGFILRFMGYLSGMVHQNSVIHYIRRMQIIWNIAVKKGITRDNPFLQIDKPKKIDSEKVFLGLNELQTLSNSKNIINPIIEKSFLFACFTGLRFSDIIKLEWQNIKNGSIHYQQTKTKRNEVIPLSKTALNILEGIDRNEGLVFEGLPKNCAVNNALRKWCKKAGINKYLHFHSARHTFAILSLEHGVELFTVSKLLGHSNISTTQIYAQILDKKKVEAINKLPELI